MRCCTGKTEYATGEEAQAAIQEYRRRYPEERHRCVSAYRCRKCKQYHFGHDSPLPRRLLILAAMSRMDQREAWAS